MHYSLVLLVSAVSFSIYILSGGGGARVLCPYVVMKYVLPHSRNAAEVIT